jgi:hypothetical protein
MSTAGCLQAMQETRNYLLAFLLVRKEGNGSLLTIEEVRCCHNQFIHSISIDVSYNLHKENPLPHEALPTCKARLD